MEEKEIFLYLSDKENSPLIVLNNYSGNGESVYKEAKKLTDKEFNLLVISGLNWDHDMCPWESAPLFKGDSPCTGGADDYLKILVDKIIEDAKEKIKGKPEFIGLAGYSLGGLFAIYAMYKTDIFDRIASMSGSLWFPDFKEFCFSHEIKRKPDKLYMSLGDKEAKTRNPVLSQVQKNSEELFEYFRQDGIQAKWELNPGNHFKDAALRSAKGIVSIL